MNNNINKNNIYTIIYIVLINIFTFQNLLYSIFQDFRYFDEIVALSLIPIFIIYVIKNKGNIHINKYDLTIVLCLIGIVFVGILSNIIFRYQPAIPVLWDILLILKFYLTYFLGQILFKEKIINKKIILNNIKILIVALFTLSIINYIYNINLVDPRFGIGSNKLFFSHPTILSAVSVFLLCNLIRYNERVNSIYTYLILAVICSTLRTKALVFVFIFILLSIYVLKKERKIKISAIMITGVIICLLSFPAINKYYFKYTDSARYNLITTSFSIANDLFPIGTGFGTFGSYPSGIYYSPVYELYGIQNVDGMTKEDTDYLSDNFWPMILGEFGCAGIILYIICIVCIVKKIKNEYTESNKYIYLSKITIIIYILISSTSESAFAHNMIMPLALLLSI